MRTNSTYWSAIKCYSTGCYRSVFTAYLELPYSPCLVLHHEKKPKLMGLFYDFIEWLLWHMNSWKAMTCNYFYNYFSNHDMSLYHLWFQNMFNMPLYHLWFQNTFDLHIRGSDNLKQRKPLTCGGIRIVMLYIQSELLICNKMLYLGTTLIQLHTISCLEL